MAANHTHEHPYVTLHHSGFTSETTDTITSALCMGSALSVCLGIAENINNKNNDDKDIEHYYPFCVSGDAAYLHSGGETLISEIMSRGANMCVIIIDNGGSVSTGGQCASVGLKVPGGSDIIHYASTSKETFQELFKSKRSVGKFSLIRVVI